MATSLVVMGVDGGGSKVDVIVADPGLGILGRGAAGGVNPNYVPVRLARARTEQAASAALAGVPGHAAAVGRAVCAGPGHDRVLGPALRRLGMAGEIRYITEGTSVRALWPEPAPSFLVLGVGTGAYAWAHSERGGDAAVDGCGYPIGDDGSGTDIGVRALRAVIRALDGRGARTALSDLLAERRGLATVAQIMEAVHGGALRTREAKAGLVPLVAEGARSGDRVAVEILRDAAREVARAATTALQRLELLNARIIGLCAGGVFRIGDPFVGPLAEMMRCVCSRLRLLVLTAPPVLGAAAMALADEDPAAGGRALTSLARGFRLSALPEEFASRDPHSLAYRIAPECRWAVEVVDGRQRGR